jgi:putative CocE/NonD family hydrolase
MRHDPRDPPGVRFDVRVTPWEPALDMAPCEAHPDVLAWTSAPLEAAVTLHGWSELLLYAASDVDDTEWHVKLTDVEPAGRSLRVAWGCLRASHRESLSRPAPVAPGVVTAYRIELSPALHTFAPGHRIRVTLAGSDFPWFARSMNRFGPIRSQAQPRTATHAIRHGGDHASVLTLRVQDGAA